MFVPLVLVACLVIGYCIKHISWLDKISNEYIPAILAVVGAVLSCVNGQMFTLDLVVSGAVTGLASVGMHQLFKQFIEHSN